MNLKLFLKTHSICFVKSSATDFDYFLKGSRSLDIDQLSTLYKNRKTLSSEPLNLIFRTLESEGIELHCKYNSGMFYSRVEVKAYFEDGGLYCAAGGRFEERRGVYLKGGKAMKFLSENLEKYFKEN